MDQCSYKSCGELAEIIHLCSRSLYSPEQVATIIIVWTSKDRPDVQTSGKTLVQTRAIRINKIVGINWLEIGSRVDASMHMVSPSMALNQLKA